ncbi:MAG: hypothetical protein HFE85_04465 [Clostridiales bacterium]|nr:hypothetical protein [Clostridiales bacterium]
MTEKELVRQYHERWKKQKPVESVLWLVTYIGGLIPLLLAMVYLLAEGNNENSVIVVVICILLFLLIKLISAAIMVRHHQRWLKYREQNSDKLKQ